METNKPIKILSALLSYAFNEELDPGTYGRIKESVATEGDINKHGKARLFVALGKKDKLRPESLEKLVRDTFPVKPKDITDIQVMDNFSFITVPFENTEAIIKAFKIMKNGKKPLVMHARGKNGS